MGNNIGLDASIGGVAAGVAKTIAKSVIPPVQKAALVSAAAAAGAAIHVGASAINAQTQSWKNLTKNSTNDDVSQLPKDINKFIGFGSEHTPIEMLLGSINILHTICIFLIILLIVQVSFKFFMVEEPNIKLLDKILPSYSNKIKLYIYKLIKLNKKNK